MRRAHVGASQLRFVFGGAGVLAGAGPTIYYLTR